MWLTSTTVAEVIQIKGPYHATTQTHFLDVLRLVSDHRNIIKPNPLVSSVCIWSHAFLGITDNSPSLILNGVADLIISQKSSSSSIRSGLSTTVSLLIEAIVGCRCKREGLTIHWHTHHKLLWVSSTLNPIVNGEISVKCKIIIFRMGIHWGNMSSLLIPLTMVIVCHDSDPIQIFAYSRNIITCINDFIAGGNCS